MSAVVPGPAMGVRMTEDYVRMEKLPGPGLLGGVVPAAPPGSVGPAGLLARAANSRHLDATTRHPVRLNRGTGPPERTPRGAGAGGAAGVGHGRSRAW